ncbi:hypothetical protein EI164_04410 [Psychrobacter sp. FME13]|nr:hypothetical protein [Psychrobacter sp. FME13]
MANIVEGKDSCLLVIYGLCSIHDCNTGTKYAQRLR